MRSRFIPALVALAMTAAACGDATQAAGPDPTPAPVSDLSRVVSPASALDIEEAVAGNRLFSVESYLELASLADGNLVLSPASIRLALAMTWAGAGGATAEQMAEVLHFDLPADQMHAALNAVDALLASRNRQESPGPNDEERKVVLTIANALWGQDGYGFMSDFLDTLAVNYGAGMHLVDFEADAEAARMTINDWVSDFTNERIPELIPGGVLSELTRLVLTNAVYLDATWARPFDPNETWDNEFATLDGRVVTAEVMHRTGEFRYSNGEDWQAVEIPYIGNELAMLVLVPDDGAFTGVEGQLAAVMDTARQGLRPASVALGLPKWEFRTQAGLVPMLRALGMGDAFDPALADFAAMTGTPELFISDVVHEAFIKVDEAGTEAAAATAVVMDLRAALPGEMVQLEIDRPFLFALQDTGTGQILFLGRVADPTS